MSLVKGIENYIPVNEQEENDKKVNSICEKVIETVEETEMEDMAKDNETVEIEEIEE